MSSNSKLVQYKQQRIQDCRAEKRSAFRRMEKAGMPDYHRIHVPGGTYFFTVNLLERKNDLLTRHTDVLRDAIKQTRRLRPFHIGAWVVMPDHMHSTACRRHDYMEVIGRTASGTSSRGHQQSVGAFPKEPTFGRRR